MRNRLLSSVLWLGAVAVMTGALLQPAIAGGCCSGGCKNPGDGTCQFAQYQGTNFGFCICDQSYASCGNVQ